MFDLATIIKAIQIVGEVTPAAFDLYEQFIAVTRDGTQEELKERYKSARLKSDQDHVALQRELKG